MDHRQRCRFRDMRNVSGILRGFVMLIGLFGGAAAAQYFSWGQDPASIRWRQIHTPHFRLIFPGDYETNAAYIADVLETAYPLASRSLGHPPRKVPVIIHNRTVVPNGFVGLAPMRLEMFTNPPPDNNLDGWIEGLALHEFRHVVQLDKLNQGFTRMLYFLTGEQAIGLMAGLFVPMWLLEGDAVLAETLFSKRGRGRVPAFEMGLRAQVMGKGAFSYDKAFFGSYRDYVPDYYTLGYQLVSVARQLYGADIWDKTLNSIARNPHYRGPLRHAFLQHTGRDHIVHYKETMMLLDSLWTQQLDNTLVTDFRVHSREHKLFTNYRLIGPAPGDGLLAFKTGLADIPGVVILHEDGEESLLLKTGFVFEDAFSSNGKSLVWSEYRRSARWEHLSWSEIHHLDMLSGEVQKLTNRTRYFSPAISPDGRLIAVRETDLQDNHFLVLLDALSGEVIDKFSAENNALIMSPAWHTDGNTIALIAQDQEGKRIDLFDIQSGVFQTLLNSGQTEIARPGFATDRQLLFEASYAGKNDIWAIDLDSGEITQWVSSAFGAAYPMYLEASQTLYWSDYNSGGYRVVSHAGIPDNRRDMQAVENHAAKLYKSLISQEEGLVSAGQIERQEHQSKPFSKLANLFHFHSWGPFNLDTETRDGSPGFSLMSQNLLSTAITTFGYAWDVNESMGRFYINHSYSGLYPTLDVSMHHALRRSWFLDENQHQADFTWREQGLKLGAGLPLNYSKGPWFMGITPSVQFGSYRVGRSADTPDWFESDQVRSLEYSFTAYRQIRRVARDLGPRFGQMVDVRFKHAPFEGGDMGRLFSTRLVLFLPGMAPHHSLRLGAAWQSLEAAPGQPNSIRYRFTSVISPPRGISGLSSQYLFAGNADYRFPIAWPDLALGRWMYITRLSGNVFADFAMAGGDPMKTEPLSDTVFSRYASVGADASMRFHLLRFFAAFDLGVRAAWIPSEGRWAVSMLAGVEI